MKNQEDLENVSVASHIRVIIRPGRFPALSDFLKYIKTKPGAWIATREEIARFWIDKFGNG
jgi:peptidoglycan/xylan/chitin deacetylase (PgdA/CDA1 family)